MPRKRNDTATARTDVPKVGTRVTIALDGDGPQMAGTITDQPVPGKMGIMLADGRCFFGYVRMYSPTSYRLLICDRIEVVPVSDVRLIRFESPYLVPQRS